MRAAHELLASRLKDLLQQRQMNQADLAERIQLSQGMVSQILAGKRRVSMHTLDAISHVLRVSVGRLFDDPEAPLDLALTEDETALLVAFRRADPRAQAAICVLLGVPISDSVAETLRHAETSARAITDRPVDSRRRILSLAADLGEAVKDFDDANEASLRQAAGARSPDPNASGS